MPLYTRREALNQCFFLFSCQITFGEKQGYFKVAPPARLGCLSGFFAGDAREKPTQTTRMARLRASRRAKNDFEIALGERGGTLRPGTPFFKASCPFCARA